MNGITRQTFDDMETHSKLGVLFDYLQETRENTEIICKKHHKRISKLENRRKFDTVIAGSSGLFGGFIAMLARWKIFNG